jgi:hypothetical protein
VPVTLRAGTAISNQVTIAKAAAPGACAHPLGLTAAELKTLDDGGSIPFGSVSASGVVVPSSNPGVKGYYQASTVWGRLTPSRAADIAQLAQRQYPDSGSAACSLENGASIYSIAGFIYGPNDPKGSLALSGPAGQKLEIMGNEGTYIGGVGSTDPVSSPELLPPPFFSAGAWSLSLRGDSTVRDFQQALHLPPPLTWTNRDSFTSISRTEDAVIRWDSAGYSSADILRVSLSGGSSIGIACRVPANSGSLTLPHALLAQLAPSANALITVAVSGNPRDLQRFAVQLTAGGSMPVVFVYGYEDVLQVAVR